MTGPAPERERTLAEAILLPEGDPAREEARRSLESQGEHGLQRWTDLIQEHEQLRSALGAVPSPVRLHERLLEIPRSQRASRLPAGAVWGFAAAAALFVALTAALVLSRPADSTAAQRLAALAMHDHLSRPELVVQDDDRVAFADALGRRAPFPVRIPAEMAGASLIGGRLCAFGESPIVYSRWRDRTGDGELSLYQVRREDFGISEDISRRRIDLAAGGGHSACRVTLWCEDEYAFAIVRAHPQSPAIEGES